MAAVLAWVLVPGVASQAADRAPEPPGTPVQAGIVAARDVPVYVNGLGTVQAFNAVAVKSRVDGQIVGVSFKEGQEVAAGARLFEIDPRPFQAALDQANAGRAKDQASLGAAQLDLQRYGSLLSKGFQTRQSYDNQKSLVGQGLASVAQDQAQIDNAKLNLSYADIRSPITGRLGARMVDIGNLVQASTGTTLVTITQLKPIFISFTVAQDQLDVIREEQQKSPLTVIALGGDGQTRLGTGELTLIDNQIDQSTGTIHLKGTFPNADERLWPGAFVNARLVLAIRRGVPTVPAETVMAGSSGHYAYVIRPDNTVERRTVELMASQDGISVIKSGLQIGERVVTEGQYRLADGAKVQIAPPAQTSPSAADHGAG